MLFLSLTNGKYYVLFKAINNIVYYHHLFEALLFKNNESISLLCNNMSSIKLVWNPIMLNWIKYIELDNKIKVCYVSILEQQANIFIKYLGTQYFIKNWEEATNIS